MRHLQSQWEVLGLAEGANVEEVDAAYRTQHRACLALLTSGDPAKRRLANAQIIALEDAYKWVRRFAKPVIGDAWADRMVFVAQQPVSEPTPLVNLAPVPPVNNPQDILRAARRAAQVRRQRREAQRWAQSLRLVSMILLLPGIVGVPVLVVADLLHQYQRAQQHAAQHTYVPDKPSVKKAG